MVSAAPIEVPVLIVGGGGCGLALSIFLTDLGVRTLMIERNATTTDHPRAHILNQRTMEIGYRYEVGALVPDGTPALPRDPMAGIYHPNTRPGSRLPHAWLAKEGQRVGTHDLLRPGRFTLLCDRALWHEAARRAARAFDIAIDAMVIDEAGALQDPQGMWMRLREVGPGGAILVRPDAHVAWRSMTLPVDPSAALIGALQAVLGRGPVI